MNAWLALRDGVHYRREAFADGLKAAGYRVQLRLCDRPGPDDVLVVWNRYGEFDRCARVFENRNRPVLVAENGYLGNDFAGDRWYAISRSQHNGAGAWNVGGAGRWDALGVELAPWRPPGGELIVLPQRGIGPAGVAMPADWLARTERRLKAGGVKFRTRLHPGKNDGRPLAEDLADASGVLTWGSGSALKALVMGVPVDAEMPHWIGRQDNTDAGRLAMFRRLVWAQWRLTEIASGEAFRRLLA